MVTIHDVAKRARVSIYKLVILDSEGVHDHLGILVDW